MSRRPPLTSRNTTFNPGAPPDKRKMTVNDMLKIAWKLGEHQSIRAVAAGSPWSPSSVHRVRQRTLAGTDDRDAVDISRGLLAHFVAFSLFKNPLATGRSMFEAASEVGFKTSVATVNRIALEMSFKSVFTQKQEKLTMPQMAYRVWFCEQVKLWFGYLLPWVFTDESLLVLNPVKRKIRVVRGVEVDEKFFDVQGYPQKVMVWGAIGRGFKSPLIRVRGTLKAADYQQLLLSEQIFERLNDRYGVKAYVFQQDGARPHTAATTRALLSQNVITLPERIHWPASSPDLNVIENVWSIIKNRINYQAVTDSDSLFGEAQRVWDSLSLETIDNIVGDFAPRLNACRVVKGECLNRHKKVLRGFRVSIEEGELALNQSQQEKAARELFLEKSLEFFLHTMKGYTKIADFSEDADIRNQQSAENLRIWRESVAICHLLPVNIRKKCRLPAQVAV